MTRRRAALTSRPSCVRRLAIRRCPVAIERQRDAAGGARSAARAALPDSSASGDGAFQASARVVAAGRWRRAPRPASPAPAGSRPPVASLTRGGDLERRHRIAAATAGVARSAAAAPGSSPRPRSSGCAVARPAQQARSRRRRGRSRTRRAPARRRRPDRSASRAPAGLEIGDGARASSPELHQGHAAIEPRAACAPGRAPARACSRSPRRAAGPALAAASRRALGAVGAQRRRVARGRARGRAPARRALRRCGFRLGRPGRRR